MLSSVTIDLNGSDDAGIDFSATFTEDAGPVSIVDADLLVSTGGGQTLTITFDTGSGSQSTYTEQGLTVTSLHSSSSNHLHLGDNAGDPSIDLFNHTDCCSTPYQFDFGGAPFTFVSVDILSNSGSANFTSSSGAVQTITGTGTLALPSTGWTNITSFDWNQLSGLTTIDNLVIQVGGGGGGAFSDSQTQNNNVFSPNVLTYNFTGAPAPTGGGILTVTAIADLNASSEFLTLNAEGIFSQNLFVSGGFQQSQVSTTVNLTQAQLAALAADGTITFTLTPSTAVNNLGPNLLTLDLSYPGGTGDDLIDSATVTITNLLDGSDESLAVDTSGTGISASYNSLTGVLSLTGADTAAAYEQVLRTITYNNASQDPNETDRTVEFLVTSGSQSSVVATSTVSVIGVADAGPPVIDLNGEDDEGIDFLAAFTEDAGPVSIVDTDLFVTAGGGGGQTLTITFDTGSGSQSTYTEQGLTVTSLHSSSSNHLHLGDNAGDPSIDLFNHTDCCSTPYQFDFGGAPFTFVSVDILSNSGSANFTSSSGAVQTITGTGTLALPSTGWTNITSFDWNQLSGLTTIDNLVIQVGGGGGGGGTFSDSQTQNNNVFSPNVLTYNFTGAPAPISGGVLTVTAIADLDASLEFLTLNAEGIFSQNLFVSGGLQQSQVSTTVNLTQAQLAALAADGTITFTLTPSRAVNNLGANLPTLDLSYSTGSTGGGGDGLIDSATATITNLLDGSDEALAVNTSGTGISASYNSLTGVLSLAGADTAASYEQVLRTITYNNASQDPNETDRTVEFLVTSGSQSSVVATSIVSVLAVNDAPVITNLSLSANSIDEGDSVTLNGTFTDPEDGDTHTVEIVWDDGSANTVLNLAAGVTSFSVAHTYDDDNPSGTPFDVSSIQVTVTDNGNLSDQASTNITVNNVAPTLSNLAISSPINENDLATLTGDISDPGTLDTFELTVDWGDGGPLQTISLAAGATSFSVDHQYLDDNPTGTPSDVYEISVTLTDDDGGVASGSSTGATAVMTFDGVSGFPLSYTEAGMTVTSIYAGSGDHIHLLGNDLFNHSDCCSQPYVFEMGGQPFTLTSLDMVSTFGTATFVSSSGAVANVSGSGTFAFPAAGWSNITSFSWNQPSSGTTIDNVTFSPVAAESALTVTVNNVAPVVAPLVLSSSMIDENGGVTVTGTFSDPGTLDTHEIVLDWGDGSAATVINLTGGERSFSATHQYLDDDPTGTSSDNYTITATVTDDDTGVGTASAVITVNNVAPEIDSLASDATFENKAEVGVPVTIAGAFSDIGTLDTHIVEVNWDDGGPTELISVDQLNDTFLGSHVYTTGGIFTIIVTLTDDDGGVDTLTTTAVVTGVRLTDDGVLQIVGTSEADHVSVNKQGNGLVKVHADFLSSGNFETFNAADVDKIIAYLCDGDDHMTIAGNVNTPAIIHGGGGNDHLNAGGGPTVLLGDAGDDMLVGGKGRDILIGGLGADRLVGGAADDVLIGGSTNLDHDDDGLMAAMAAWDSGDSYDDRVAAVDALLSVADDGDDDVMTGSAGRDLFYDGLGDKFTDLKKKNPTETVL